MKKKFTFKKFSTPSSTQPSNQAKSWWQDPAVMLVVAAWLILPNVAGVLIQQMVIISAVNAGQQNTKNQIQHNIQQMLQLAFNNLPERLQALSTQNQWQSVMQDPAQISHQQQQLAALLPANSQVLLMQNGQRLPNSNDFVLMNFINQLDKGEKPIPQVFRQGNQVIYRAGIELVSEAQRVGILIISLPINAYINSLPKLDNELGYLEVATPIVANKMLSLYSSGDKELKPLAIEEKKQIAQIPLSIFLHIDNDKLRQQLPNLLFWLLINAASLLSLGLWLAFKYRENQLLIADLNRLVNHLNSDAIMHKDSYHLTHFQLTEDQLKHFKRAGGKVSDANTVMVTQPLSTQPVTMQQVTMQQVPPKPGPTKLNTAEATKTPFSQPASAANPSTDDEILNLDLNLEDTAVFDLTDPINHPALPATLFRQYDIRGIVEDSLTPAVVRAIGHALGTQSLKKQQSAIVIGRDGRHSSAQLSHALAEGIMLSGCNVLDIGEVPTPQVYFATYHTGFKSGVMVTGSHNPPQYNGLKMVVDGETLFGQHILDLKNMIENNQLAYGNGAFSSRDISEDYLQRATQDIVLARRLKVVVDAGNGVAGPTALQLLERLGCDVIPLYCDIDGNFPNHHPDPSKPENLKTLISTVQSTQADLGIAFDGDGDRLGVVTNTGRLIYPDRLLMYFAKDILSQHPGGDIIFDVKCTSTLNQMITQWGGRPLMWKTGHSLIKAKLKETGALIAGEMSGHIFFNDRWFGFDDALYSAVRLLELISMSSQSLDQAMQEIPELLSTPELNIAVSESNKFKIIETLKSVGTFSSGKVSTLDGIRVDYPHGWGLIRASNTTPVLVARFEAETQQELSRIQQEFAVNLAKVDADLKLPI